MTNLDKLEMEILTNGSLTPENALKFASNVLKSYFELFNVDQEAVEPEFVAESISAAPRQMSHMGSASIDPVQPTGDGTDEKYTPIEILGFSPRTLNALINGGIGSIEQLTKCSPEKIAGLRGFGSKALDEVNEKLASRDLTLSMTEE